jgi:hypothetical protein
MIGVDTRAAPTSFAAEVMTDYLASAKRDEWRHRAPGVSCVVVLALFILGIGASNAAATNVGGYGLTRQIYGPMVVSGQRAFVPRAYLRETPSDFAPKYGEQSVGSTRTGFDTNARTDLSVLKTPVGEVNWNFDLPAIAASGGPAVVAWEVPLDGCQSVPCPAGVSSAVLSADGTQLTGQFRDRAVTTSSPPRVATNTAGNRLIAWTDADQLRVQRVATDGTPGPVLTVGPVDGGTFSEPTQSLWPNVLPTAPSPKPDRQEVVSLADSGVGWAVWKNGGHLFASRIVGDAAAAPTDLGTAPSNVEQRADPDGGLFVLLSRGGRLELVHLGDDGTKRTLLTAHAQSSALALDGANAVAAWSARARRAKHRRHALPTDPLPTDLYVRTASPNGKGTVAVKFKHTPELATVAGVAVDHADRTEHMLLDTTDGAVMVDASRRHRPLRSRTIGGLVSDATQIETGADGIVVTATTKTAGVDEYDHSFPTTVTLLKDGKVIGRQTYVTSSQDGRTKAPPLGH